MKTTSHNSMITQCLLFVLLLGMGASAQETTKDKSYPLHGKVITAWKENNTAGSGGFVGTTQRWVYRIDCGDVYYDLRGKGKSSMDLGQEVTFRVEKEDGFVSTAPKEVKYKVVGFGKPEKK